MVAKAKRRGSVGGLVVMNGFLERRGDGASAFVTHDNSDISSGAAFEERLPVKGRAAVSSSLAYAGLPGELGEFLARDTYSLLVKGESGTGKTTLALTILRALQPIENLLYLSTRTSPLQLVEDHPWIEDVFGPARVGMGADSKESEGWETLVDARLDEPNVVFETITNVLMDKQAPTVVIDSWESLGDTLGIEAIRTNIRVLQSWRERAGARFIFLGEDPANSSIDSTVEGVVELKERLTEGRRLREIVLSKLHGIQIQRPSYFFTLRGGVFSSFPAYAPSDYAFRNPTPVSLDRPFRRSRGRYPTGYDALDSLLDGGYPSKSLAVVEVDRGVDPRVGLIFVSRTVQDWLAAGDEVLLWRPKDVEARFMNQFVKSFGAGAKRQLVVAGLGTPRGARGSKRARRPGAGSRRKTLVILGKGLQAKQRAQSADGGHGEAEEGADLTIVVGRTDDLDAETEDRAATHFKLVGVEGTLFVECERPWSSLCAVVPGMTGGNPMILLEPVV